MANLVLEKSEILFSFRRKTRAGEHTTLVEQRASNPSFWKGSSRSRRLGTEFRQESIRAASFMACSEACILAVKRNLIEQDVW